MRYGRKVHRALLDRFRAAEAAGTALGAALAAARAAWDERELAVLMATGHELAWQLRRTAMAAQRWLRAASAGQRAEVEAAQAAFAAAADAARAYVGVGDADSGTAAYVAALTAVRALTTAPRLEAGERGAAVAAVNELVLAFNRLTVPGSP
jgi:hypothetical protein